MTTLEQQIAHLQDYWKVPQEDVGLLIKLAVQDYFDRQETKRTEFWNKAIIQMKASDSYSVETNWSKPVEEVW